MHRQSLSDYFCAMGGRAAEGRLDGELAAAAGAALARAANSPSAPARRTALGRRSPAAQAPDLQRSALLALRAGLRGARHIISILSFGFHVRVSSARPAAQRAAGAPRRPARRAVHFHAWLWVSC